MSMEKSACYLKGPVSGAARGMCVCLSSEGSEDNYVSYGDASQHTRQMLVSRKCDLMRALLCLSRRGAQF